MADSAIQAPSSLEASMLDLAFVLLGVGVLALTALYAVALQRI